MPPFVVTLGTFGIAQSIATVLTKGDSVTSLPPYYRWFNDGVFAGIPVPIWATIAVFALTWFLLYRTKFGRYVFAIGGNRRALILSGTRVNAYHIAVYVYAGLLAGIASFIMTARMNAAHPTIGVGLEFDAIAAVILGGTSFEKGRGGIVGTVIGALAVGVLRNGLNLLGVGTEWQVAIVGVVIIVAVGLDSTAEAERMSVESAKFPSRWTSLDSDQLFVVVSRLIALALLIAALSFLSPHFLTWSNLINVLRQASLQFLMSAGLTIVVLTAGIDLSVGAVLGLSACISASLISNGHVVLGIGSALLAGTACGVVNGVIVTIARIPPFIATYGMLWIAFGLGYVFMKGEVIYGLPEGFRFIGAGFVGFLPVPVIVRGAAARGPAFRAAQDRARPRHLCDRRQPGRRALSGMPVTRRLITVYGLSGFLAGFAALVVIARVNAADSGLGEDLLLPAIAAVCLGGTSLFGGVGGITGTAVGSLILALIVNGMNLLGVQTFWQSGVMGAIILISVLVDQLGGPRLVRQQ